VVENRTYINIEDLHAKSTVAQIIATLLNNCCQSDICEVCFSMLRNGSNELT